MKLYPYQEKIVTDSLDRLKKFNELMIVVPTGGGKTVIFGHLVKETGLRTLILAHTRELITQCDNTLTRIRCKNFSVMTIQKYYKNHDKYSDYDFLIIDECHRSCSASYIKAIEKFKGKKLLGVTATPFRSDGQWLMDIYKRKICSMNIIDMIEQGFLSDFEGYRVRTECSLRGISTKEGDFIASKLASIINISNRNELIVREYNKIAPNEKALCFAANIKHAIELAKEFEKKGIPSASVHGELPKNEREKILRDFKDGNLKVLVNCQILTEGFDEPSITCLLMARPTLSKVLYMQMIGRGSRKYPGKEACKVIEFTDNNYEVSQLEELLYPSRTHTVTMQKGERLSNFRDRTKLLMESSENTTVEKYKVVTPSLNSRLITSWQKNFLGKLGISFEETTTEMEANNLIIQYSNG